MRCQLSVLNGEVVCRFLRFSPVTCSAARISPSGCSVLNARSGGRPYAPGSSRSVLVMFRFVTSVHEATSRYGWCRSHQFSPVLEPGVQKPISQEPRGSKRDVWEAERLVRLLRALRFGRGRSVR